MPFGTAAPRRGGPGAGVVGEIHIRQQWAWLEAEMRGGPLPHGFAGER
jgi:hypothetical protein